MRKIFTLATLLFFGWHVAQAQQDPMFSKYMFNTFTYNPGFAGSYEHMYVGLLHRSQWIGFSEGVPQTQTLTLHTPLKSDRVGVGLNIINDAIGPTNSATINAAYAYRIPLGENAKLSIGLQGGVTNYRFNQGQISLVEQDDAAFIGTTAWLPNFGAGLYFYTKSFYFGFASPHLVEYDLRNPDQTPIWARSYRHYFASVGGLIPLRGDDLVLKPSVLIKNVGFDSRFRKDAAFQSIGAPTEFDLDLGLMFYESFTIGASFRSAIEAFGSNATSSFDSADVWFSYFMSNGLRIGAAYDYPLNEINRATIGSFELMLGYELNFKDTKTVTPRYF